MTTPASPQTPSRSRPKRPRSYLQALAVQERIITVIGLCADDAAQTNDRELRSRIGGAIAAMVRGWDILEERKRILRNKPLPGHLRPDMPPKARRTLPTFSAIQAIDVIEAGKESLSLPETVPAPDPRGGAQ